MHITIFLSKERKKLLAVQQAAQSISRREEIIDKKIKLLDAELLSYGEQIKKTKPGHTQDALKAHALLILKQKRRYESQKNMLDNQRSKLENISNAARILKKEQKSVLDRFLSLLSWNICT